MLRRTRNQSSLLERYWELLRRDRAAVPPDALDRPVAQVAARLARDAHLLDVRGDFAGQLEQRLVAEAERTATRSRRTWSGPALDKRRRTAPPQPTTDTEEYTDMSARQTPLDQPTPIHSRRWAREGLKLVAAALIFGLIGALLALALRDNDDDAQLGAPVDATPSAVVTSAPATPTVAAVVPNATASPPPATSTAEPAATATVESTATTTRAKDLPALGEVVATITVEGSRVFPLVEAEGSIWVPSFISLGETDTLFRIDPTTNQVVAQIEIPFTHDLTFPPAWMNYTITAGDGAIWVSNWEWLKPEYARIDPATNEVSVFTVTGFDVSSGGDIGGMIYAEGSLWAPADEFVLRIDPLSHSVVAQIPIAPTYLVSYGFDTIWVTSSKTIARVDPATNTVVAQIAVDDETFVDLWGEPVEFTADAAFIVADRSVLRIDPTANELVATIPVGFVPYNTTSDADTVWLRGDSAAAAGFVARFDPATNTVTHYTKISGQGDLVVSSDGDLWITSGRPDGLVERVHLSP